MAHASLETTGMVIPIALLPAGHSARIDQLVGAPEQVHRLEEMGLRRGAAVVMVQPGSPCIIGLAGSRLCFREAEAAAILVETLEAA